MDDVCAALGAATGEPALLHRDFYDKQIVVDDAGGIGLIDFDTFAVGSSSLMFRNPQRSCGKALKFARVTGSPIGGGKPRISEPSVIAIPSDLIYELHNCLVVGR